MNRVTDNGIAASSGGLLDLQSGASGTGTLLVNAGSSMELDASSSVATLVDGGSLHLVNGTVTATSFIVTAGAKLFGQGTVTDIVASVGTIEAHGGVLTLAKGATGTGKLLIDAGARMEVAGPTIAGVLIDHGSLQIDDHTIHFTAAMISASGLLAGSGAFLGPITDLGVIEATGGLLAVGATAGGGQLEVGNGASLELKGSASPNVTFFGVTGSLLLDRPSSFTGIIENLTAGDLLVFKNAAVSSASFSGGILTVSGGGSTIASLHVAGLTDGTAFVASSLHTIDLG